MPSETGRITGLVTGVSGANTLLVQVWPAAATSSAAGPQRDPTATRPSATIPVTTCGTFAIDVTLSAPPGSPNLFVLTTYDTVSSLESQPVHVQLITASPPAAAPSAPKIQTVSTGSTPSGFTYRIKGTCAPNTTVELWRGENGEIPDNAVPLVGKYLGSDPSYEIEFTDKGLLDQLLLTATAPSGHRSPIAVVPSIVQPQVEIFHAIELKRPSHHILDEVFEELAAEDASQTRNNCFHLKEINRRLRSVNRAPLTAEELRRQQDRWSRSKREQAGDERGRKGWIAVSD